MLDPAVDSTARALAAKLRASPAIAASWQAARRDYGKFLGFTLLSGLFSLLGILVCCVGVWVTQPIAMMAAAVFYADVTGTLGGKNFEPAPSELAQP